MLKRIFLGISLFLITISVNNIQASNTYSSVCDRTCYVKNGTSKFNLDSTAHGTYLGQVDSTGDKLRVFFQWDLSDNIIPNASIIKSATLTLSNITANSFYGSLSSYLDFSLFSVRENLLLLSASADSLWARTDSFNNRTDYIISGAGDFIYADQNGVININKTYSEGSTFTDAIAKAIADDDFFTLGIISKNEPNDYYSYDFTANATLQIVYEDSMIIIDQKRSDGTTSVKTIRKWESTAFSQAIAVPDTLPFVNNQHLIIEAYQDTVCNPDEKYRTWKDENDIINHHEFIVSYDNSEFVSQFDKTYGNITVKNEFLSSSSTSGGTVKFKDPWFIDSTDASHANAKMNRGQSGALFYSRTSPFTPNFTTAYNSVKYLGVFLNQSPDPNNPSKPYYSVKAQATQNLSVHGKTVKGYFQYWSGSNVEYQHPGSYETAVVFKNSGASARAMYKGHFASDKSNAYSSNSQRKLIQTNDGKYHTVYVDDYYYNGSLVPAVYYTHSTSSNFSDSWTDETVYDHLAAINAANPSIDYYGNHIYGVYELKDGNNTKIIYSDEYVDPYCTVATVSGNFGNCKPVIAVTKYSGYLYILIAWKPGTNSVPKYSLLKKSVTGGSVQTLKNKINIPNTTSASKNLSIVVEKGLKNFHLVWEDNSNIKYQVIYYTNEDEIEINYNKTISSGSGYDKDRYPSISLHKGDDPIVTWQGGEYHHGWDYYMVLRHNNNGGASASWQSFRSYGNDVDKSNVNSDDDISSVVAFRQTNGYNYYLIKDNHGYGSLHSFSPTGNDIQVSNGEEVEDIKIMNYKIYSSAPHLLQKANVSLSKTAGAEDFTAKRRGVITKGEMEFVFEMSDVMLDGQNIQFKEFPDSISIKTLYDLNKATRTQDMNLDKSSELLFSHKYYVVNEDKADKLLSDKDEVKFRVELVRSSDDYVCGVVKEMVYNKNNADAFEIKDFKLDCSGLKADKYYLRLKTAVKGDAEYFMGNGLNGSETLEKKDYEDLEVAGVSMPLTYELAQNYPNPFNPVTTISYAVPNAGVVEITIYDIRGRIVKTLLDTYKEPGRYTIRFDGKQLSSGLYIYRLKSGDFITQRKMLLVK